MAKTAVYNMEGKEVGDIELKDEIFSVNINEHLIHMAVRQHLAAMRQGTQKAKTRAEVRGGGRKPWRQKGTGHARQGSTRSPQWTGGGVVFAPTPRDYSFKMNKKEKRTALKSALSAKLLNEKIIVVDELKFDQKVNGKTLVVTADVDENVVCSARNIPDVSTIITGTLGVYDIMNAQTLVLTKDAVNKIEEVYI